MKRLLVILGGLAGCGDGAGVGSGADAGRFELVVECVMADEPTYQPYSNDVPQEPLCESPPRLPLPADGHVIDLRDTTAGSPGTCGAFGDNDQILEIDGSQGFPLWIRLPAVASADPACADHCGDEAPATSFGLALSLRELLDRLPEGKAMTVRVPAPWFFVAGDEHRPTTCLNGAPSVLEFAQPLACASTWGLEFGFATGQTGAAAVDAVIDLVDAADTGVCCPYTCPD